MPDPFTIKNKVTGKPLGTFDLTGNLNLAGTVTVDGPASEDGTMILPGSPVSGGGGGGVSSVTAGDASVTVGGTAFNPAIETGTLDEIAALHPPAASWSNNGQKIQGLANGALSTDAAALGQVAQLDGVTYTGYVAPAVVALTFAATIAVNAALGNDFRVTLTASTGTLGTPANPVDGQRIVVQVTQGTGGGFTLAYQSGYEFSTSLPSPTLSATAGLTDLLGFIYNAAKGKWLFVAFVSGFS